MAKDTIEFELQAVRAGVVCTCALGDLTESDIPSKTGSFSMEKNSEREQEEEFSL